MDHLRRIGALALLQHAFQIHDEWVIFVPADPAFAALRSDKTFQSLVQSIAKGK